MGRPPTQDDLSAILVIYNDAVLNSTAIWNDRVVDLENAELAYGNPATGGLNGLTTTPAGRAVKEKLLLLHGV